MKYLECVLKEAMRLFPPVPVLSRRLVVDTKMGKINLSTIRGAVGRESLKK